MTSDPKVHPHDIGLSPAAVRKRRQSHRLATIMLTIAVITAAVGWFVYFTSVFSAIDIPSMAIIGYCVLIISSITLVLGFWYMLRAQVERDARMVDAAELDSQGAPSVSCPHCRCHIDTPDRFCRHCGKPLQAS